MDIFLFHMHAEKNHWWSVRQGVQFNYVAEPTPYIRYILEEYYGPLDWDIPYV